MICTFEVNKHLLLHSHIMWNLCLYVESLLSGHCCSNAGCSCSNSSCLKRVLPVWTHTGKMLASFHLAWFLIGAMKTKAGHFSIHLYIGLKIPALFFAFHWLVNCLVCSVLYFPHGTMKQIYGRRYENLVFSCWFSRQVLTITLPQLYSTCM